jgi:hypothetical protein
MFLFLAAPFNYLQSCSSQFLKLDLGYVWWDFKGVLKLLKVVVSYISFVNPRVL